MNETRIHGTTLCGSAALVAALVAVLASAPSRAAPLPAPDDAAVEGAFWDCDARSTREALSVQDAIACAQLTDTLRLRRFDGDFGRFLAWWRDQRREAYARRGIAVPGETSVASTRAPIDR